MRNLWMVLVLAALAAGPAEAKRKKAPKKAAASTMTCSVDADCATTRFAAEGECCPTLCQPRAVAKASAEALAKHAAACGTKCAARACAPPQQLLVPACDAGKCVLNASSLRD